MSLTPEQIEKSRAERRSQLGRDCATEAQVRRAAQTLAQAGAADAKAS